MGHLAKQAVLEACVLPRRLLAPYFVFKLRRLRRPIQDYRLDCLFVKNIHIDSISYRDITLGDFSPELSLKSISAAHSLNQEYIHETRSTPSRRIKAVQQVRDNVPDQRYCQWTAKFEGIFGTFIHNLTDDTRAVLIADYANAKSKISKRHRTNRNSLGHRSQKERRSKEVFSM